MREKGIRDTRKDVRGAAALKRLRITTVGNSPFMIIF
jgi:hypothetical protein